MVSGGPNDHPISDILVYSIPTYGLVADAEFRELSTFLSERELNEFWELELGWKCDPTKAATAIEAKLSWALERARKRGWDVDES